MTMSAIKLSCVWVIVLNTRTPGKHSVVGSGSRCSRVRRTNGALFTYVSSFSEHVLEWESTVIVLDLHDDLWCPELWAKLMNFTSISCIQQFLCVVVILDCNICFSQFNFQFFSYFDTSSDSVPWSIGRRACCYNHVLHQRSVHFNEICVTEGVICESPLSTHPLIICCFYLCSSPCLPCLGWPAQCVFPPLSRRLRPTLAKPTLANKIWPTSAKIWVADFGQTDFGQF